MSSFIIKLIATISMLIDHSNDALVGHFTVLNVLGRIAFPLFCFQLIVGYTYTHDLKKYIFRVFVFALISQIPFSIFSYNYSGTYFSLNVFFFFFFGLLALYCYDSKNLNILIKLAIICIISFLASFLKTDYGAYGVILLFIIYLFYPKRELLGKNYKNVYILSLEKKLYEKFNKNNVNLNNNSLNKFIFKTNLICFLLFILIWSLVKYLNLFNGIGVFYYILLVIFTFLPSIFMLLFNGKKGYSFKYGFYAFYPLHIAILDIIHYFIF